jgi:hypothetical protein
MSDVEDGMMAVACGSGVRLRLGRIWAELVVNLIEEERQGGEKSVSPTVVYILVGRNTTKNRLCYDSFLR